MLISKNNLLQFIDISNIDSLKIKELLTQHTAEVENIYEKTTRYLNKVVIGKIIDIKNHPDSTITKVRVTKVDIGRGQILNIFCGAQNIDVNMYVPVALQGAILSNGIQINTRELKGVVSEGMICSKVELGLDDIDDGGIWNLNNEISQLNINENDFLGFELKKILGLVDDTIFDIDNKTLSNRPDLFCHKGIARELSVLLDLPLQDFDYKFDMKIFKKDDLNIKIQTKNCFRYTSIKIDNVEILPSPLWLKRSLESVGIQSINNIVDITNYVMIMIGQPMHAFDFNKINGIIVRQAKNNEKIILLNNKEYKLNKSNILICDINNKPIALAGIMGSINSAIDSNTTSILLESACFDPYSIRKSSIDLSIRTDASTRYEKALDPELTKYGLILATKLILDICKDARVSSDIIDIYNKRYKKLSINISKSDIKKVIGIDFDNNFIEKTLLKLGFDIQSKSLNKWNVYVPSWRATRDISIKEDIAEEIARIYGFNNIKSIQPIIKIEPVMINLEREFINKVKIILSNSFHEVFVYSFSYKEQIEKCNFDFNKCIQMLNSLTSTATTLIPSLMIPLLECVYKNSNNFDKFRLFTVDNVWIKDNNIEDIRNTEKKKIAGVVYGYEDIFYETQSELVKLLKTLKIGNFSFKNKNNNTKQFYPTRYANIFIDDIIVGFIGNIHPKIIKEFDINKDVCYFEFDLNVIFNMYDKYNKNIKMKNISVYQSVRRDLNFVFDENIKIADILNFKNNLILEADAIDIYRNEEKLGKNKKSITISYIIGSYEKTLTDNEINNIVNEIIMYMYNNFNGVLRS